MATTNLDTVVRHVLELASAHQTGIRTDRELLGDFRDRHDQGAFAVLVRRHGDLVLRVCWRVLANAQDAEDAFQATFLILARKAASIGREESLAGWLHGVAQNVARRAKRDAERRRIHEAQAPAAAPPNPAWLAGWREVQSLLDEEIQRLPEKYRTPFILCVLEGQTPPEAARQLGVKEGTVWSRLSQARRQLRDRLSRRGVTLTAMLAGLGIVGQHTTASAALRDATIRAAARFAAGGATDGLSSGAAALAERALKSSVTVQLKWTGLLLAACGLVMAGTGLAVHVVVEQPAAAPAQNKSGLPSREINTPPVVAEAPPVDLSGDPLPPGARLRLGTERFRHGGLGGGLLTFSADGKTMISAHGDGVIHFWEAVTGKEIRVLRTGASCFLPGPAALSPGGKFVALPCGNVLRLWDLDAGKEVDGMIGHGTNAAPTLAFSANGKLAATGGSDGVRLWEVTTGKELRRFEGHRATVIVLAFAPEGQRLASKGSDGTVFLWDTDSGKELRQLQGNPDMPGDVCWSPDGKTLALGDGKAVVLVEAATGQALRRLEGFPSFPYIHGLTFSADGRTVAVAAYRSLHFYETSTGKALRAIDLGDTAVGSLAFSPDGKTLAATGTGCAIRVWEVATGKELHDGDGHRGAIHSATFSPDGRLLATAAEDSTLRLWDAKTGQLVGVCQGRRMHYRRALFSADGQRLMAFAPNNPVEEWDVTTRKQLRVFAFPPDEPPHLNQVQRMALSPAATTLTAVNLSRSQRGDQLQLISWDVPAGKPRTTSLGPLKGPVELSPDGTLLAILDGPVVHLREVVGGRKLATLDGPGEAVINVVFSRDDRLLAGVCERREGPAEGLVRTLVVWELATSKELYRVKLGKPGVNYGGSLAFSADGRLLALGGDETNATRLWDLANGKERPPLAATQEVVTSLVFSPDGTRIVTGMRKGVALVWDVPTATDRQRGPAPALPASRLKRLWHELAVDNPARAYAALWELAAAPTPAVDLLQEQLRPVTAVEAKELARLIADLDHNDFTTPEAASRQLEKLGPQAEAALRKALKDSPATEVRRRVEDLLTDTAIIRTPDRMRRLRAIAVLEIINSKEARRILAGLADGAPTAYETKAARAALERLGLQPKPAP